MRIKQIEGRVWIGRTKTTFARTSTYFGYINFVMLLLTFYSVTGYRYAPLPVYVVGAVVGVIILGAVDYFIMLPSDVRFNNQQFVKHQNPIYEDVKAIRAAVCDDEVI